MATHPLLLQLSDELRSPDGTCRRGGEYASNVTTDDGRIRGRAVPYDLEVALLPGGELREVFRKGAFRQAVKDPRRVRVCLEHGQVIGRVTALEEREDGLWFTGAISDSPDIPEARKARAMLEPDEDGRRLADELSIGFQEVAKGSRTHTQPDGSVLWEHRTARLTEISLVPWGVYGRHATVVRAERVDRSAETRRAEARAWVQRFASIT